MYCTYAHLFVDRCNFGVAMRTTLLPLFWLVLIGESCCFIDKRCHCPPTSLRRFSNDDPNDLMEKAKSLRKDVEDFQAAKQAEQDQMKKQAENMLIERKELQERYSAVVPILKPDGTTQEERCDFSPRWKEGSRILLFEASLPIGVILGESEEFGSTTVIDEVAEGSNGESAGLQVEDLVRAFTACKVEMEMPTWQIIAGGIGVPKTKRFMYSADGRPFEEVMQAVASNRQDPEERPVLIVVERKVGNNK